jgi:Carboxypeptidase regulatory-like domain
MMKPLLLVMALMSTSLLAPQVNTGVIEGRITRPAPPDGISDVQVTLIGPSPISSASSLGSLYTPNPALTPAMRDQINQLLNAAPPTASPETIANTIMRLEAQLLGLPLPPALQNPGTPPPQTTVITDREGLFAFRNLAPGRYQIRAQREGYFGPPPPGIAGIGAPTTVNATATVTAGQPTPPLSLKMLRGAVVAGRARDPNGQPLQTAQITAYQITYQNGRKVLQQATSRQTDDRGDYRLYWLPPGDYLIGLIPRRGPVNTTPSPQDSYARTFYPSTADGRTAQIVHAGEGVEVSGIDLVVRPDATARISGRVITPFVGANGQPAVASAFYLFPSDPTVLSDSGLTNIQNVSPNRANGQFELRGLLPGQYELMSNVPDGNGRTVWGRTRVQVSGELNDVTLPIQPGIEVKVRLTVDGAAPAYTMQAPPAGARGVTIINGVVTQPSQATPAAPVPTPTYRVQLRSAENFGTTTPFESAANQDTTFDPSGVFVFRGVLEGRYVVGVSSLPPNGYVADVKAGGTSVFDSGVDINSQTGEIQVLLNTNGGRIQGVVVDATQQPVASARVALVPRESRRQNLQLYRTSQADNSGKFTLNGIAPGDYKLFAWEAVQTGAWMNAEFLAGYENRGVMVSFSAAGSTPATIELRVIPKD